MTTMQEFFRREMMASHQAWWTCRRWRLLRRRSLLKQAENAAEMYRLALSAEDYELPAQVEADVAEIVHRYTSY